MKFELLIIYYVSLLNSLTIERRRNDKIFGITEDACEDMLLENKRDKNKINFCKCENGTFLSRDNHQYKCNNEEYLGRLF